MTERAVIASLSEQLAEAQDKLQKTQAAIEALKEENSAAIKDQHKLHLDVAYLLEYKRKYRDLVAIMIVVGIISILGFALWSVI